MAKQNLKEAGEILEKARQLQQYTIGETGKKKTPVVVKIVVVVVATFLFAIYKFL